MALTEFELIARYFSRLGAAAGVTLGVGDDAALLRPEPGCELAVTVDTLVEGIHFTAGCDPEALGHKLLAVNLSDLAAMGAAPRWVTLALTLPRVDPAWLTGFSRGLAALAAQHGVALVGGDTTRGPLTLTLQAIGLVPSGQALRRDGARAGDRVFVSGTLGDAGLALAGGDFPAAERQRLQARLDRPEPRVALGQRLRGIASAAIDLSDGLAADLGHILAASGVGATLELARLPLSGPVAARAARGEWQLPLASGDDYELCCCVPPDAAERLAALPLDGLPLTCIGTVDAAPGLRLLAPNGTLLRLDTPGYTHFESQDDPA